MSEYEGSNSKILAISGALPNLVIQQLQLSEPKSLNIHLAQS